MGDFVMLAAALRNHRQLHASGIAAYALLFVAVANISPARAAEHTLMPSPQTVHIGYFLASIKPVLSIESGDVVTLESVAAIVPSVVDQAGVVSPGAVPQYHRDIYGEVKDRGPGPHVLTGPIEVKGAMPGDVLEVRILDINLALDWGYNRQRAYTGALPEEFTGVWTRIIPLNRETKTAEVAKGVVVPIDRPFFGTMGLAPDPAMGRISSGPPGVHTGNLDNKDLVAGTTLYMPVHAPGALLDEDRGARDHRPYYQALPEFNSRGGLHDRERSRRLSRHPGGRRHQGDSRHDPEIDLHRAAIASRHRSLAQSGRPKTSARFVRFRGQSGHARSRGFDRIGRD